MGFSILSLSLLFTLALILLLLSVCLSGGLPLLFMFFFVYFWGKQLNIILTPGAASPFVQVQSSTVAMDSFVFFFLNNR